MTKIKSTKHALLMSTLALLMCVSMFVGSTFAWFTDSVTSGSNVIQAGTLDIVMEYWDGDSWEDAEGKVLEFIKGGNYNGYVGDVLWEPGCTYELPKIRVRNEGDLAAKLILKLNGVTGDEKLMEVIKLTTTITNMPESVLNGSYGAQLGRFNNATVDMMYGTPDGTIIFDWSLMAKGHTSTNSGHTDTSPEFTISGHMDEEAGNEYQGLKIEGVSITALATQEVYEYDSFGREYDKNAPFPEVVATAADLKAALAKGGNVSLDADIKVENTDTLADIPAGVTAVLDLNGHNIDVSLDGSAGWSQIFHVNKGATLIVNGEGNVHATSYPTTTYGSVIFNNDAGTLVINGGTYTMTYGTYGEGYLLPAIVDTNSNIGKATTTINGGTFYHNRNMFRNFAQPNRGENNATLEITGGTFIGEADDYATIWNQKTSSSGVEGDGVVNITGGEFTYMDICNDFATGVTVADGINIALQ